MMTYQDRLSNARRNLSVARDGNTEWAVIWTGDKPMVVYSGLASREAAEVAMDTAMHQLADNGQPYGPSALPDSYFNAVGDVLMRLKRDGAENLVTYAAKVWEREGGDVHALIDEDYREAAK